MMVGPEAERTGLVRHTSRLLVAGASLQVPMILSTITVLMLLVSGWLGGKMVYEAGVGVDTAGPR